ncbi:MAG: HEAT repeat domain-containing protein, partial [Planctomycetota bacterium]
AFLGLILAYQAAPLAHGGGHPTPWPTPPPTDPGPTPSPTPTPTPNPAPPPPAPTPGGRPTPTNPGGGPAGTPQGGQPSFEVKWKTWWEINKWRFTWTPQRGAVVTDDETGEGGVRFLAEFLVQSLEHKNFDIRGAAALALGRAGSRVKDMAVPALQKLTEDKHWVPAESAVLALGMLGSKESVPMLSKILENQKAKHRMRAHAAVALGLIGDKSASRIMMDLVNKPKTHIQVRGAALMGLALMKEEAAAFTVLKIMNNRSEKEDLRAMAATALGKMGFSEIAKGRKSTNVVEALVKVLANTKKDKKLKLSAIMAVCALGPSGKITPEKLVDVLGRIYQRQRSSDVRSFILVGIAELASEGRAQENARRLFRNVLQNESNQDLLSFACLAAGISKDRASIKFLRKIFQNSANAQLRSAAAVGLGLLKDVDSTELLLAAIEGKGAAELKGYCCISLGLMGAKDNKEALPTLRTILTDGSNPQLQAASAMALTLLGEANAVDTLLKVVAEGNAYSRMSMIMAIGYFRDMNTVKPLIDLFHSKKGMNDEIRAITLTALGYIAEEAEVPILKRISAHYNYHLRKFEALLQIVKLL